MGKLFDLNEARGIVADRPTAQVFTMPRRPRLKLRVEAGLIFWDVGAGRELRFDADAAAVLRDVFLTAGEMDAHFDVDDAILALSEPDGAA